MNCFLSENWDLRLSTIWNMRWASWKARWALIFWMATPPQTRRLPGRNREYHCKGYRAQPIHALLLGGSFGSSPALKFQGQALPSSRPIKSMLLILEARQESGAVMVSQGLAHRKETTEFSQENRWPKGADVALWSDEFHPFSNANAIAFYGDGISWSIPIEVVRSPQSLVEAKVSTLECTRSSIHKGSACLCIFGIHLAIGLGFIVFKAVSFDLPNLFKLDAQALVRCGHWDRIWILSGKQQWRIWDSSVTVAGLRQRCGICIDMQAYPEYIYIYLYTLLRKPLKPPLVKALCFSHRPCQDLCNLADLVTCLTMWHHHARSWEFLRVRPCTGDCSEVRRVHWQRLLPRSSRISWTKFCWARRSSPRWHRTPRPPSPPTFPWSSSWESGTCKSSDLQRKGECLFWSIHHNSSSSSICPHPSDDWIGDRAGALLGSQAQQRHIAAHGNGSRNRPEGSWENRTQALASWRSKNQLPNHVSLSE